ncbi:MAG: preprotein translocase subunit SecE [Phascolarctobacterium sp.]|nr:preprotein translocase subunit SecE [Phascolarctobacterium sp.]
MSVPETTGSGKNGNSIVSFLQETRAELKKVTWATRKELISNTIVVLIAVLLCAVLNWVIDAFFSGLFRLFMR